MPSLSKEVNLSPKTWFSLIITVFLFGAVVITQLATLNTRDNRSKAATCDGVATLRPNNDYRISLWADVPNSGSYYSKVSELGGGDGDATFIWDDTVPNNFVSFGVPSSGLTNQNIVNVTVNVRARRGGSAAYTSPGFVIGGKTYFGSSGMAVSTTYSLYNYTFATNPATGASWTVNDVNNLKIAAFSVRSAQSNPLLITQMWADVCYQNAPPPPPAPAPTPTPTPPTPAPKPKPRPTPTLSAGSPDIVVNFAPNLYLKNKISVNLAVAGTSLTKAVDVLPAGGPVTIANNNVLTANTTYTLQVTTKNTLSQSISFKYVSSTQIAVATLVPGDFNRDNQVDSTDLNAFITKGAPNQDNLYDLNADGVVNSVDYSLLLISLGKKGS